MSNPIGWCTDTINPMSGCTNCDENGYCFGRFKCYAEGFAKRLAGKEKKHPGSTGYPTEKGQHFKPTFHADKLWDIINLPTRKPKRVFLDSMSDWFCEGVPAEWVHQVLDVIDQVPEHYFLVLTKRPDRILDTLHCRDLPPNLWLGVSVTCQGDTRHIDILRKDLPVAHKFVSFEPLRSYIEYSLHGIEWAIIGAETGNDKGKILPERRWVSNLIDCAEAFQIPVFLKDNLQVIMPNLTPAQLWLAGKQSKLRQEFPEAMA